MGKKRKPVNPSTAELTDAPRSIPATAVRAEIQQRLAAREPEVELLAADIVSAGGSPKVKVFVDSREGVTLETCTRVTRALGDLLREYSIEVSSPGPDRPLSRPEHFRRFIERRVRVRTYQAIDGRNDFKGELIDASDEQLTLAGAWGTVAIPYQDIRRSNLIASTESARRIV